MCHTELRIGNITFDADGNVQVIDAIEILAIRQCEAASHPVEFVRPIPLTEDWLKRFGFNKEKVSGPGAADMWSGMPAYSYNGEWIFRGSANCLHLVGYFNTQIRFVHSLQNLHFALTGKELTLTL